jgi:hypothetical protein
MIKFFRKIRQKMLTENKFSKYLIYAIGEIILVVIGILIALSINNWNEERKESLIEQNYLRRLLVDLENDYKTLTFSKGLSSERINQVKILTNVIKNQSLSNENSTQIIESIEKVTWRSYLPLSKIVYNELLNSGKMSLIQSEELRDLLSNYYVDADHWEMILNFEDAQKMFSHATAGLLSIEILAAIENSSSLRNSNPTHELDIDLEEKEFDRIFKEFSTNTEAIKWLPNIYHYHLLADKVITNLSANNETIKKLVQSEMNK